MEKKTKGNRKGRSKLVKEKEPLTKCRIHPRYRAIRKPRVDCLDCWKRFGQFQELRFQELRAAFFKDAEKMSCFSFALEPWENTSPAPRMMRVRVSPGPPMRKYEIKDHNKIWKRRICRC